MSRKQPGPPAGGKPFIPYVRNSDLGDREAETNVSFVEQRREIDRIAERFGLPLLDETIADEDTSGATFDRPGWHRAMEMVRKGEAAGVVAFDLKRISRGKTAEVLMMVEDVEHESGQLYDSSGRVSVEEADDELVTTVKAMIARREWRERRAYRLASVRNAIERGVHLSAPFGYRKANGKGSRLVLDDREAPLVVRMFELRADGFTWPKIAQLLNEGDVPPRPYTRHKITRQGVWRPGTVRGIVTNEVYTGTAYNGEHRTLRAHKEIVSPELYARANRAKGTRPIGPTEGYMLTGLVRCASCGYVCTHRAGPHGRYYVCSQNMGRQCARPTSVPAASLEAHVVAEFRRRYLDEVAVPVANDAEVAAAGARVAAARSSLSGSMAMMRGLDAMSQSEKELAQAQLEEDRAKLRDAEEDLARAKMAARGADLPPQLTSELFDAAPLPEQRHWLSLVFRCVVVRPAEVWREPAAERCVIVLVDDAPVDSTRLIPFATRVNFPARAGV